MVKKYLKKYFEQKLVIFIDKIQFTIYKNSKGDWSIF
jgi:hypothetical protein